MSSPTSSCTTIVELATYALNALGWPFPDVEWVSLKKAKSAKVCLFYGIDWLQSLNIKGCLCLDHQVILFTVKAKKNIIIILQGKDKDYISAPKPLFSQSWSGVDKWLYLCTLLTTELLRALSVTIVIFFYAWYTFTGCGEVCEVTRFSCCWIMSDMHQRCIVWLSWKNSFLQITTLTCPYKPVVFAHSWAQEETKAHGSVALITF